MKNTLVLTFLFLLTFQVYGQKEGNGNIITKSYPLDKSISVVDVQINADVRISKGESPMLTITTDANIIDDIGQVISAGKLTLDQKEWINASKEHKMEIVLPSISKVYQGSHSTTYVTLSDQERITLEGNVGKIIAQGAVQNANIFSQGTTMDLSQLDIDNAYLQTDGDAVIQTSNVKKVTTKFSEYTQWTKTGEIEEIVTKGEKQPLYLPNPDLRYIDFKIKNNSLKRNAFVVVGPKQDGRTFSYGFSLNPYASKKERWSVGTRIYKESRLGKRELLVTISESDENSIVKLF